jgi:secondary thiamine-phosphate synthase enzyme
MHSIETRVSTGDRLVTDITLLVQDFCERAGSGLLNVFVPHATAGVAVIETGSGTETDLQDLVDRMLPPDHAYRHRHGTTGHGRAPVLPAVVSASLTVPVVDGHPTLGTWQSIVLVDSNVDNTVRHVRLTFLPG